MVPRNTVVCSLDHHLAPRGPLNSCLEGGINSDASLRRAVSLIARSTVQKTNFIQPISLENGVEKTFFSASLGRAMAATRPVTPFGTPEVNSDKPTHKAPDEVWSPIEAQCAMLYIR